MPQEKHPRDVVPRSIMCPHMLWDRATVRGDQDVTCLFNPRQNIRIRSTLRWRQRLPNRQNVYLSIKLQ
jgi:hypothetical protein